MIVDDDDVIHGLLLLGFLARVTVHYPSCYAMNFVRRYAKWMCDAIYNIHHCQMIRYDNFELVSNLFNASQKR